jgi:hypothetical protein
MLSPLTPDNAATAPRKLIHVHLRASVVAIWPFSSDNYDITRAAGPLSRALARGKQ